MNKIIKIAVMAIIIVIIIVHLSLIGLGTGNTPVAFVTFTKGDVTILRKGSNQWVTSAWAPFLYNGDKINTAGNSLVEITFENNSITRLNENSLAMINGLQNKLDEIYVDSGQTWTNAKKMSGKFRTVTKEVVVSVRGTVYQMDIDNKNSTSVIVHEGAVDINKRAVIDGQTVSGSKSNEDPNQILGEWISKVEENNKFIKLQSSNTITTIEPGQPNNWVNWNQNRDRKYLIRLPL